MSRTTFRLDVTGPPQGILRSDPVRAVLAQRATAIAGAAGPGMGVATEKGKVRSRAAAITISMHARYRERRRHTLEKALKVGRSL